MIVHQRRTGLGLFTVLPRFLSCLHHLLAAESYRIASQPHGYVDTNAVPSASSIPPNKSTLLVRPHLQSKPPRPCENPDKYLELALSELGLILPA